MFKVPGKKDLYIALGDRWLPRNMDLPYSEYAAAYENLFNPECEDHTVWESFMKKLPKEDTSIADYVWLPITFDGEKPTIHWQDQWSLDDFADSVR